MITTSLCWPLTVTEFDPPASTVTPGHDVMFALTGVAHARRGNRIATSSNPRPTARRPGLGRERWDVNERTVWSPIVSDNDGP